MTELAEVLAVLARLVAFDTQNPPRAIGPDGIVGFVRETLGAGFACSVTDLGDGCVSLLAVRGTPKVLFNVHLDTVPVGEGWTTNPLELVVEGDRAIGRGAADVKGAAACLIVAAARTKGDVALLFTTDEEAGSSRCVRAFLETKPAFASVVVAEPTGCLAVAEHRGIATCLARFQGRAGHASSPSALQDSAIHEAVRWANRALAFAEENETRRYKSLSGIRLNLGVVEGGTKANMIASSASVRFGVRPLPDQRPADLLRELGELALRPERAAFEPGFLAPPLPAPGTPVEAALHLAASLGLPNGDPVDFWTEAALFSEAGLPSLVYGPGHIREAHTAGEWVKLSQLDLALGAYERLFSR